MKKLLTLLILLIAGISSASAQSSADDIIADWELQDIQPINAYGTFILEPAPYRMGLTAIHYYGMLSRIPGRVAFMGSKPIQMFQTLEHDCEPYSLVRDYPPKLPEGNDYSGEVEIPYSMFCPFDKPEQYADEQEYGMQCVITTIGYGAFANCVNLTSVKLPSGLEEIRRGAFANCTSLTKIDASECSNVRIYPYAFHGCTNLTSIDLSFVGNVSYYGGRCFDNCPNLKSVILNAENDEYRMLNLRTVPSLETVRVVTENPKQETRADEYDPFFEEEYQNAILIVPDGSKEKYQTALPWKNFANIMTEGEYAGVNSSIVGKEIVNLDGKTATLIDYDATAEIFDATGLRVAELTPASPEFSADFPGIFIIRSGANTQKVVLQ